jgi:phage terminase small subunit
MRNLDAREQLFVAAYLIDLDPKQAALTAGYSATMATTKAYQWVSNGKVKPHVYAAVQAAIEKRAKRSTVTADRVLAELAKIGFSNLSDVTDWGTKEVAFGFDDDGKRLRPEDIGDATVVTYADAPFVKPINRDDLPPDIRAAVAEVSLGRDGFKIKMHDKGAALALMARHLGMLVDKSEISGPNGSPIQLQAHADELASLAPDKRAQVRSAIMLAIEGKA